MPPDFPDFLDAAPHTAVLLVSHGSKESAHSLGVEGLSSMLSEILSRPVHHAYLEAEPALEDALHGLLQDHKCIYLVPLFVFAGRHVKVDLPRIASICLQKQPGSEIRIARALDADLLLADLAYRRVEEVCRKKGILPKQASACIYLAHGSTKDDVKREFLKQSKLFFSRLEVPLQKTAFLGLSGPYLKDVLAETYEEEARLVLIALHVLFDGKTRDKAKHILKHFAKKHPDFRYILSPPLGADKAVAELLAKRLREAVS